MKLAKKLILCVVAFIGTATYAQTDETLQFVDKDGNVVPDGSTITVTDAVDDGMGMGGLCIYTGLSVKNNSSENVGANVELTISQIDNGALSCCFPGSCQQISTTGTYETQTGKVVANSLSEFNTEWYLGGYGTCTTTFKLKLYNLVGDNPLFPEYEFKGYGPSVTVNFVYSDPSGIDNAEVSENKAITGIYTIGGQQIEQLQKGINIVKYSNGKSAKIVVK